ncbi:MAG: type II toxin-antitoxin system HicA family toxin [Elusimicrobia bacterium]|nr:type II toxin-antitoxin system HicA family toxin [Elusimicrobiota bacterium]
MRLPSLSSSRIIRALRAAGFTEAPDRGKGSHRAFVRSRLGERTRLVIVPYGHDIPRGTLRAILEQAGLTRDEFLRLLDG